MTEQNDIDMGGPAFPLIDHVGDPFAHNKVTNPGLTIRDYFAAAALAECIAIAHGEKYVDHDLIAEQAYDLADAMLKARKAVHR